MVRVGETEKTRAAAWFEGLRDRICAAFEALEDAVRDELVTMSCGRLQATEDGWFLIDETVRRLTA